VLAGGGALLMPVEITKAVAEGRSVEFAVDVLKGIAGMPAHLYNGLSSDDPALRGAAFAESMMVVAGSATLARSFSQGVKGAQGVAGSSAAASEEAAAKIANNFYREGAIADTSKTMSATGPWKSVAELAPKEVDAMIAGKLPPGSTVTGSKSADGLNAISVADKYDPPYVPGTKVLEVATTQQSSFVRVFGGDSRQVGSWVMRAEDIQGLTPQQIASKFSLPQVPVMIADVTIPAGVKLEVSAANSISPNAAKGISTGDNVGGGGVQFRVLSRPEPDVFAHWFSNPRVLK
jgi:filamentous hemagglutinin